MWVYGKSMWLALTRQNDVAVNSPRSLLLYSTLFCPINVGYHLELHIAITIN